ncbi:hypothetical protein BJ166DRAFT_442776, partial [Pestalotiopsis sp. NC0098]
LVFPPQGKGRATVDADDIERLDEGEFLNDNLIIFYLRYLQDKLEKEKPRVAERIHFHNTFFYDKLKPSRSSAGINYNGVKSWTSKVDLFTKDFIVVPINEHQHWYVAIIYNPSKLDPSQKPSQTTEKKHDRKHDPNQPKIITLDSLGAPHSPACTHLRQYLIAELKDKKGIEIPDPGALGMTAKKIPEQQNHCDCGLYLLGYVQHFLDDPDAFVHGLLQYDAPTWSFVSSEMRH